MPHSNHPSQHHSWLDITREGATLVTSGDCSGMFTDTDRAALATRDPTGLASAVQQALLPLPVRSMPISIALCRSFGCLHVLELPQLDADTLHEAVSLQLEATYRESFAEQTWDYVVVDHEAASDQLLISAFCVPSWVIRAIEQGVEQSNHTLAGIHLREALFASATRAGGDHALLAAAHDNRVEIVLSHHHQPLQAQSVSTNIDADQASTQVEGVGRRLLASLPQRFQPATAPQVQWVVPTGQLAEDAQPVAAISLAEMHPLALPSQTINLADPQHVPKPNRQRRLAAIGVAALCLLGFASMYGYQAWQARLRSQQAERVQQAIAEVDQSLQTLTPAAQAAEMAAAWATGPVPWAAMVQAVNQQLAEEEAAYVVRMDMNLLTTETSQANLQIEGRARNARTVSQLANQLAEAYPWLRCQPLGIEPNRFDPAFPTLFRLQVTADLNASTDTDTPQSI